MFITQLLLFTVKKKIIINLFSLSVEIAKLSSKRPNVPQDYLWCLTE